MSIVLYDKAFKIVKDWENKDIVFWKIIYEWEEIRVRFKMSNLKKITEYIQEWFWRKWSCYNSVTWSRESQPLKQHLKDPDCNLFYW